VTHLHRDVTVTAPRREWADAVVREVPPVLAGFRFAGARLVEPDLPGLDVRLVAGDHLAPGARYLVRGGAEDPAEVTVDAWDPAGRVAVAVAQGAARSGVVVEGLRVATVDGRFRAAGRVRRLREVRWHAEVDVDRWWAGLPAVDATVTHAWAGATLRVTALPVDGADRWQVRVEAQGRGRSFGRLVAAVCLLVWRPTLTRSFREACDDLARAAEAALERWSGAEPADAARALVLASAAALAGGDRQ
jgi:hypothetical protein